MTEPDWDAWTAELIQDFVNALCDALVDRAIPALEEGLQASPDHLWPPPPKTAHPWLAGSERFVRDLIEAGRHDVVIPFRKPVRSLLMESDPTVVADNTVTLTVVKAWRPAPYTDVPFIYVWKVAMDRHGRWVTGDSWPVYHPDEPWRRR